MMEAAYKASGAMADLQKAEIALRSCILWAFQAHGVQSVWIRWQYVENSAIKINQADLSELSGFLVDVMFKEAWNRPDMNHYPL